MVQNDSNFAGKAPIIQLCFLLGIFFMMITCVSIFQGIIQATDFEPRTKILIGSFFQSIFLFIIPAYVGVRIGDRNATAFLGLKKVPAFPTIVGIVIAFIVSLPALNQIIWWNENITFPESLKGLETAIRGMENAALESTNCILDTTSWGGLISGVLIVGIITGLGEELFFRGALQQILVRNKLSPIAAIWLSATIFSILHFQFFGFVPRLLLGAFFGYLLYWTKSIWVSALAHTFNNSIVVITAWEIKRGYLSETIDSIGVDQNSFPWYAITSAIVTILFLISLRKYFFFKN